MTVREIKDILNKLDEKYDDYPLLTFDQDNLVLSGAINLNKGEINYDTDKPIPFMVLENRTFGNRVKYKINASYSIIGS